MLAPILANQGKSRAIVIRASIMRPVAEQNFKLLRGFRVEGNRAGLEVAHSAPPNRIAKL